MSRLWGYLFALTAIDSSSFEERDFCDALKRRLHELAWTPSRTMPVRNSEQQRQSLRLFCQEDLMRIKNISAGGSLYTRICFQYQDFDVFITNVNKALEAGITSTISW